MSAQHKKTKEPVKKKTAHPHLQVEIVEEQPTQTEKIIPEVKTQIIDNPDNSRDLHITSEVDITIPASPDEKPEVSAEVTLDKQETPKILEPIKINDGFELQSSKEEKIPESIIPEEKPVNEESEEKENISDIKFSKKSSGLLYFTILFVLSLVVGGLFFYVYGTKQHLFNTAKISVSPTPVSNAITLTPAPAELSRAELGKYNIKVLNGTDTAGLASKLKDSLTTAGFNVSGTGNADNSNYTKTVIEAKSAVEKPFLQALQTTLNKNYVLDTIKSLADSEATDLIIIIGSQAAK